MFALFDDSTPRRTTKRQGTRWVVSGFSLMALLSVSWLAPPPAAAWQLPARHALRRASEALRLPAGVDGFEWVLHGKARTGSGDDAVAIGARWRFARSTHRAAVSHAWPGKVIPTWVRGEPRAAGVEAPTSAEMWVLPRLFGDGDPATLAVQLGIDPEKRHLALLGEHVAEVLGAASSTGEGRDAPQLWLSHDEYLPLRVAFRPAGGPPTRIDLLDWDAGADGIRAPRRIVVHEAGRWVRTWEVEPARRSAP
jgi:hypothetical protein